MKPNVLEMLNFADSMDVEHLEDAYFFYQRHYDLFFNIDDFHNQNNKLFMELDSKGFIIRKNGMNYLKDISVKDALKQLGDN